MSGRNWTVASMAVLAALAATALPGLARAETIAIPPVAGGMVDSRQVGSKTLSPAATAGIAAWLEQHRSGWQPNLATPPVADVTVSLQTTAQTPAVVLSLWPDAAEAGWRRSVLIEVPASQAARIQTFPEADEATLLDLIR